MSIDKTIQDLFAKLDEQKKIVANLRAQTQKGWVTNGTWKIPFSATVINIQTLPEDQLVLVAGEIANAFSKANEGASFIANGDITEKMQGYTREEWRADLIKRKAAIQIRSKEAKLAELEDRLNSVLSPEERRRIEVELLAKELGE